MDAIFKTCVGEENPGVTAVVAGFAHWFSECSASWIKDCCSGGVYRAVLALLGQFMDTSASRTSAKRNKHCTRTGSSRCSLTQPAGRVHPSRGEAGTDRRASCQPLACAPRHD